MPIYISGTFCVHTTGNYYNSTTFFYPTNEIATVVSLISQHSFSGQIKRFQQFLCHADIMAIATGKQKTQWISKPIRHRMDFCRQTSSTSPSFFAPFLAPLACWCTLMLVLSSISVVSSTKSSAMRADKTLSHTPERVHVRNRLYTVCHGPNRSGRSRQGIPVFSQYRIAWKIKRLLFPGRPPCGFFSGGR